MGLGTGEIILIFVVVLLLFGPSKLPDLARSMGEAVREFRKGQQELEEEFKLEQTETKDKTESKKEE